MPFNQKNKIENSLHKTTCATIPSTFEKYRLVQKSEVNKGKQINYNGGEIIEYIIPVQSDVALSSCTTISGVSAGLLSPGGG